MAKSDNKTLINLVIIAGIGFILWKLWPTIKKGLGGSSSGYSGSGGASPQYPYPNQSPQQPSGPSLSLGGGGSQGGGGGGGGGGLGGWLNNILNQGYSNAAALGNPEDSALTDLNNQGLNSSEYGPGFDNLTLQNLNNLPSYSANDPNAPWNSDTSGTDVGSYDLSSVAIDPGNYDPSGDPGAYFGPTDNSGGGYGGY